MTIAVGSSWNMWRRFTHTLVVVVPFVVVLGLIANFSVPKWLGAYGIPLTIWPAAQAFFFVTAILLISRRLPLAAEIAGQLKLTSAKVIFSAFSLGTIAVLLSVLSNLLLGWLEVCGECQANSTYFKPALFTIEWSILEELWNRGILFNSVRYVTQSDVLSVILSAIVFAMLHSARADSHWFNSKAVVYAQYFSAGLCLAVVVIRYSSLWVAAALHVGLNLPILLLQGSHETVGAPIIASSVGPGKIVLAVLMVIGAAAIWPRRQRDA